MCQCLIHYLLTIKHENTGGRVYAYLFKLIRFNSKFCTSPDLQVKQLFNIDSLPIPLFLTERVGYRQRDEHIQRIQENLTGYRSHFAFLEPEGAHGVQLQIIGGSECHGVNCSAEGGIGVCVQPFFILCQFFAVLLDVWLVVFYFSDD